MIKWERQKGCLSQFTAPDGHVYVIQDRADGRFWKYALFRLAEWEVEEEFDDIEDAKRLMMLLLGEGPKLFDQLCYPPFSGGRIFKADSLTAWRNGRDTDGFRLEYRPKIRVLRQRPNVQILPWEWKQKEAEESAERWYSGRMARTIKSD